MLTFVKYVGLKTHAVRSEGRTLCYFSFEHSYQHNLIGRIYFNNCKKSDFGFHIIKSLDQKEIYLNVFILHLSGILS